MMLDKVDNDYFVTRWRRHAPEHVRSVAQRIIDQWSSLRFLFRDDEDWLNWIDCNIDGTLNPGVRRCAFVGPYGPLD